MTLTCVTWVSTFQHTALCPLQVFLLGVVGARFGGALRCFHSCHSPLLVSATHLINPLLWNQNVCCCRWSLWPIQPSLRQRFIADVKSSLATDTGGHLYEPPEIKKTPLPSFQWRWLLPFILGGLYIFPMLVWFLFLFWDKILVCSSGRPRSCELSVSASWVLGRQAWATLGLASNLSKLYVWPPSSPDVGFAFHSVNTLLKSMHSSI